jgi:hypothetical protein
MKDTLKKNNWINYDFWCLNVYTSINRHNVSKDIINDKDIESDKSKIITAIKIV